MGLPRYFYLTDLPFFHRLLTCPGDCFLQRYGLRFLEYACLSQKIIQ